ncbi:MAG: hypothetical protein H5U20_07100 [Rhodobacteraceae bacterium]|nr:hypothetical protein [Paracoccaceae bacterium]
MARAANVFVLCAGRCGSVTFARAAAHMRNFTVGHESRTHLTGPARLDFSPGHVEVDNRLGWFLGRLERRWGDRAAHVHLLRDPEAVAQSFLARADRGILLAYRTEILMNAARKGTDVAMID